jgi:proteic killer suppression protein
MELEFEDSELEDLAFNERYAGKFSPALVKMVRRCLNYLIQAPDRRAIYSYPGYHTEKLKGKLQGLYSLRLNKQYRLIIKFVSEGKAEIIRVLRIEDYH